MKKILAICLVLGMASVASATLQISANGNPDPIDSEITILPSEEVMLDIWTDAPITQADAGSWHNGWALVVLPENGSISGGVKVAPFDTDAGYSINNTAVAFGLYPGPEDGVGGTAFPAANVSANPGDVIFDQIVFHCESLEDAQVLLYSTADFAQYVLQDSLIIHQPEPMTLSLLGLGGLALIRRRRRA